MTREEAIAIARNNPAWDFFEISESNDGDIDHLVGLMQAAAAVEREACAKLAMTEAALQHELDTVRNPKNAVLHSPDSAKWQKMAAMIRMRSNKGNT